MEKGVLECWCPMRLSFLFGLGLILAGCAASPIKDRNPEVLAPLKVLSYSGIDPQLGEHLYPDENLIAERLSVVIEESRQKQRADAGVRANRMGKTTTLHSLHQ